MSILDVKSRSIALDNLSMVIIFFLSPDFRFQIISHSLQSFCAKTVVCATVPKSKGSVRCYTEASKIRRKCAKLDRILLN